MLHTPTPQYADAHRVLPRLAVLAITVFLGVTMPLVNAVTLSRGENGRLTVTAKAYKATWSTEDGKLLGLGVPGADALVRGADSAWTLAYADGSTLTSAEFLAAPHDGTLTHTWGEGGVLTFVYASDLLEVHAIFAATESQIDLRGAVRRTSKPILQLDLPARLVFDPDDIRRVVFPQRGNSSLGLALRPGFFRKHSEERAARFSRSCTGTAPYQFLLGGGLHQIDDSPAPCRLTVTEDGARWLSSLTIKAIDKRSLVINRAPTAGQMEVVLVDSPNGPALCATQFGGKGYFLRFTGKTSAIDTDPDQRLQVAMVVDALEGVARRDASFLHDRKVAVVSLRNGPPTGGWSSTPVQSWLDAVKASRVLGDDDRFAVLTTPGQVKAAMRNPDVYAAILNPYGEWLPTGTPATWEDDIKALREFVIAGSVWVEVGGFPFYYILEPVTWQTVREDYPPAVADFSHIVGKTQGLAIYGVQPLMKRPWQGAEEPETMLVPTRIATGGTAEGGCFSHAWFQAVEPQSSWQSPPLRFVPTMDTVAALKAYAEAIGLDRDLSAKMSPETLATLKGAMLIRLHETTFASQTKAMSALPEHSIVHFTEYLHGGFDKQYPDHLPPRESWGTAEQLGEFYRRGHELGHLMMPYTNTSWWCIGPKGETFLREGDAPLARKRDGGLYKEKYSTNEGYTACYWHPAVLEAHRRTRRQMSEDYPSDIVLQDQVGARGWGWDYNPASPCPTAGIDGFHSLSMEDALHVPVATEDGYDRVAQFESMLCGMAWSAVPAAGRHFGQHNKHRFAPGDWEFYPILGYLAHDKAVFTLHDLGHFVENPERLSYCMVFGYSMSYACTGSLLKYPVASRWLYWLDAVQKTVCSQYTGKRLISFDYPLGGSEHSLRDQLMVASYDGVTIVANVGREPIRFSDIPAHSPVPDRFAAWCRQAALAGPGVIAWTDTALVAWVAHPEVKAGVGIVADLSEGTPTYDVIAPAGCRLILPGEAAHVSRLVERPVPASAGETHIHVQNTEDTEGSVLALTLPVPGGKLTGGDWREKVAPGDNPRYSTDIAVIAIPGAPTAWTDMPAEQWLDGLRRDPQITESGLTVTELSSGDDLQNALTAPPEKRPFAIINTGGEVFYGPRGVTAVKMLEMIRTYVEEGGIWWETGGYSFYSYAVEEPVVDGPARWIREGTGPSGAGVLSFRCANHDVDDPARPLLVTATGVIWLGEARTKRISAMTSGVQRGFTDQTGVLSLVEGGGDPFAAAIRCGGMGWLWRLGGFRPNPAAAKEIVAGVLVHLARNPWVGPPMSQELRLWRVRK